ncbi:PIN domain-containing protein [Patescibacteria group bacterium]|nr:PIN domain-containing protein [Patescibacteria group bacterium]
MAKRRSSIITAFLDSSVLFTAVNSPTGGSAKLFTLEKVKLIASQVVLAEVERNVQRKLQHYHLERFFMLTKKLIISKQLPNNKLITKAEKVIVKKDAVILAEAKQSEASFLITLDRKHFLTTKVKNFLKPQKVLTPKMFFEEV